MDEKQLQQKAMEWQILEANMRALKEQQQMVMARYEELQVTRATIEELDHTKAGKALIPIGAGNFIHGKVEDSKDVIVGVGGGIAIKKNRKEAIEVIEGRAKELEKAMNDLAKQEHQILQSMQELQLDLQKAEDKK